MLLNNGLILASEHYKYRDGATMFTIPTVEWLLEAGIIDSFYLEPSHISC